MNVKLLQDIKAHIVAEPDAFRMDVWSCGTAHCIAGWAVRLNDLKIEDLSLAVQDQRVNDRPVNQVAAELLDLTEWKANALFNVSEWPEEQREAYDDIGDSDPNARAKRAALAAEVIDLAIANDFDGFASPGF
jgi:hypothetical protein